MKNENIDDLLILLTDEIKRVSNLDLYSKAKFSITHRPFETEKLFNDFNRFVKLYERQKKRTETIMKQIDKQASYSRSENEKKEVLLAQQSKMAAMGEMMDAVAHQWKQPLNSISMISDILVSDFKDDSMSVESLVDMTDTMQDQIKHMVQTLSEFRTFFRPNKSEEPFGLKRCISSVLILLKDELIKNNIEVIVENEQELIIDGIENEFKHLVLNIINNAKDAFNEREIVNRKIYIRFYKEDDHINLEIEDTARGIPEEVINDIFKPNVTTKGEEAGSGIGLYMSQQIAQKHNGFLSVMNTDHGALFMLEIGIKSYL